MAITINFPDGTVERIRSFVPFVFTRAVDRSWCVALDDSLELRFAWQWREKLLDVCSSDEDALEWDHFTSIAMGAFFDERTYQFSFYKHGTYSYQWIRQFGVDYSAETVVDTGKWRIKRSELILLSDHKAEEDVQRAARQPLALPALVPGGREARLPVTGIICGQTSSVVAQAWEDGIRCMVRPDVSQLMERSLSPTSTASSSTLNSVVPGREALPEDDSRTLVFIQDLDDGNGAHVEVHRDLLENYPHSPEMWAVAGYWR